MVLIPPPVYVLAGAVAQKLLAPPDRSTGVARKLAGGALAATAVGLDVWATREFSRHRTTINPMQPANASAVMDTGPFAYTRNPIYLAMTCLLAGHALARGGVAPWLPVAGFVAAMDRIQIPAEEHALQEKFGEHYAGYADRVPRWLGLRT